MFLSRRRGTGASWRGLAGIAAILLLGSTGPVRADERYPCFCSDASLCQPIRTGPRKEIYGFMSGDAKQRQTWRHYDWGKVTTLAWADDDELTCHAHAKGVRVVLAAPTPIPLNGDAAERSQWIDAALETTKRRHMDGVVFDFEDPLPAVANGQWAPQAAAYVALINETTRRFHDELPGSQVSVCLAWSPNAIDGRHYDNLGMIRAADLAYIMDYDTRSQIFDACVASANAAYPTTALGLQQYLELGADPYKLILGVPWYGYDYPCKGLGEGDDRNPVCPLKYVPFRGVNCSDAAGVEVNYEHLAARVANGQTTTGRQWEGYMGAPWYNYRAKDGTIHQVWYDDPESLVPKYALARGLGLRGVGPYTFDDLDYTGEETGRGTAAVKESRAMWDAFGAFLDK